MTEKHWDVYVSYKNNPDGEVALDLVDALEKAGLKCWISCRDVSATQSQMRALGLSDSGWAGALHFAIRYSHAMVVVISDAAMKDGKQLQKEIDVGDKNDIKFFPVLLENVLLRDSFDLHLGREQFINCFSGSGSKRFLNVASEICAYLSVAAIARKPAEPASSPSDAAANEELEGQEEAGLQDGDMSISEIVAKIKDDLLRKRFLACIEEKGFGHFRKSKGELVLKCLGTSFALCVRRYGLYMWQTHRFADDLKIYRQLGMEEVKEAGVGDNVTGKILDVECFNKFLSAIAQINKSRA